jgi:restriction system protein
MNTYPPPRLTFDEFEREVKRFLDGLGAGLADYRSTHRDRIAGIDGEYEFDVSVKFTALGADFLTLVECKHHRQPVGRDNVLALHAKMQSVGAQKGMVFATGPFTSGAIEFADIHGIALVQLADGRTTWFRKGGAGGPVPWAEVPDYIPRIAYWWLQPDDSRRVIEAGRTDGVLLSYLKA